MAYLLLQSEQQAKANLEAEAKEVEKEDAKKSAIRVSVSCQAALDEDEKRATRVSVSCQTAFDEEELEESAESGKTAAIEATERAAKIRAALGANLERSPVVIAALRRVAQAKAAREAAKDEAAVELQTKDKPKAVTEVEQGQPDALESQEGPINGLPDEPGCPQQVGVADGWGQLILQQMSTLF